MKVVIVGGVAGGASAAARIRRLDEHAQIIMIERSGYVSYANCGLPYYVGGVIKEQEELTLQTPESFWDRFRIDVRVRQEVTAINLAEKTVTVHALDSGKVYTETYDKLLLAPGAKPTVPALSGVDSERVFTLRTVEDTLRIRRFVEDQKPKTAVLAGGGFIGLEMAENLAEMGVSVTIVQRPKQLLAPLDADMASFVHAEMRKNGVDNPAQLQNCYVIATNGKITAYRITVEGMATALTTYHVNGSAIHQADLPDSPTYPHMTFCGWYTTPDYQPGTEVTGASGASDAWAKMALDMSVIK